MDLFQAGVEDRPGVRYQCVVSMSPPPSPTRWARNLLSPWKALSSSIFTTLHGLTSRLDSNYPCAAQPDAGPQAEAAFARAVGTPPGARSNDGVVPLRSQIWGEVVWAGLADHLDVLGHFDGAAGHADWLTSGASFDATGFDDLCDQLAKGLLASVPT